MKTLRRKTDFDQLYKNGKRIRSNIAVVLYATNSLGYYRVAVATSRKLGNAVIRNRIRRRVRAALCRIFKEETGHDIVIFPGIIAKNMIFFELEQGLAKLLDRIAG